MENVVAVGIGMESTKAVGRTSPGTKTYTLKGIENSLHMKIKLRSIVLGISIRQYMLACLERCTSEAEASIISREDVGRIKELFPEAGSARKDSKEKEEKEEQEEKEEKPEGEERGDKEEKEEEVEE